MNIVLTGGTGFIGLHLARALHEKGHHVLALTRPQTNIQRLQKLQQHATCFPVLPTTSVIELCNTLKSHSPTILIHLAAHYESQHQAHTLGPMLHTNLIFATQVLDACTQLGIKACINTGTSWQHRKDNTYNPVNLYAASKQAFEAFLTYYVEHHGLQAITLKLFDTYGPQDPRPKLFNALRKAALDGTTLRMSAGNQLLDLLHIDDVIEGYLSTIDQLNSNQNQSKQHNFHKAYFLSNGQQYKLRTVVNMYTEAIQRPIHVQWGVVPYRSFEVMQPCTCTPILPNWKPNLTLKQGIIKMELAHSNVNFLLKN